MFFNVQQHFFIFHLIYFLVSRRPTCKELPAKAKVVICGGGAQGAAIAYKLGREQQIFHHFDLHGMGVYT